MDIECKGMRCSPDRKRFFFFFFYFSLRLSYVCILTNFNEKERKKKTNSKIVSLCTSIVFDSTILNTAVSIILYFTVSQLYTNSANSHLHFNCMKNLPEYEKETLAMHVFVVVIVKLKERFCMCIVCIHK